MDELEVLTRFRSDVPAPSARAQDSARSALAESILVEHGPEPLEGATRRGVVARVVALAAAVVVIGGGLTFAASRHSPTAHGTIAKSHSRSLLPLTGPTLRLANYSFKLPSGFVTVDSPCTAVPSSNSGDPITGGRAAASADGGCLEAAYAVGPGTAPPTDAQPVQIGGYQAFLATTSATSETLYVAIPAATGGGDEYLVVLTAVDLSASQLIAIATTAFSGFPISPTPCSDNCG
jgi:hypothetical protein